MGIIDVYHEEVDLSELGLSFAFSVLPSELLLRVVFGRRISCSLKDCSFKCDPSSELSIFEQSLENWSFISFSSVLFRWSITCWDVERAGSVYFPSSLFL